MRDDTVPFYPSPSFQLKHEVQDVLRLEWSKGTVTSSDTVHSPGKAEENPEKNLVK